MKKQEVDHILTRMLDSHSNVSDLNFTVGKPLQVESAGELVPWPRNGPRKRRSDTRRRVALRHRGQRHG